MPGPVSGRGRAVPPQERRHNRYGSSILPGDGRTPSPPQRKECRAWPGIPWEVCPWLLFTPPPRAGQGPTRPLLGAGRFILALTGGRSAEYPPAGANALTAGAVWCGGVKGAFFPSPAWVLTHGFWAGCRGPLLLSGRISVIPACTFGWID